MSGLFGGGAPSTPTQRPSSTVAPMITSYRVQTAVEGLVIPILYGRNRLPGNIIYAADFQSIAHIVYTQTSTTTSGGGGGGGGKGGGGGSSTTTQTSSETTYTYIMAIIWGLCEGPIQKIGQMWREKALCQMGSYGSAAQMLGNRPQNPPPWLAGAHPDQSLGYSGLAFVHDPAADLGDNAQLPNWSFEVWGLLPFDGLINPEANPADIIPDLLSNPYYGAGFDPAQIADLDQFSAYCIANNFLMSPFFTEQKEAREHVADLLKLLNSQVIWSDDLLKILPMGDETVTGNGVTFIPETAPVLDLTEDDFIAADNDDPIKMTRNPTADVYNCVRVEYLDAANAYNTAIVEAKDQANIERFGLRPMDTIIAHALTNQTAAQTAAQNILQFSLYARNTHEFKLGLIADILEPLDWVTLTIPRLGLDHLPVRINTLEQDDQLITTVQAVEWPLGTAHAALYPAQERGGLALDFNASPGNVNPPAIFEPPAPLTTSGFEVWCAASGGPQWGGAEVWVSLDGATYKRVGEIRNPARTGKLRAACPSEIDPDLLNTLAVDLVESRGELVGASQTEVNQLVTLCYVDGELIAYRDAELIAAHQYDLTYLRRGCYNSPIKAHSANSQFARLDGAVFKFPFGADQIGTSIWIKFLSYNTVRGGRQALADVEPYQHILAGDALKLALPNVEGLVDFYRDGRTVLKWTPVNDVLSAFRTVDYEVRKGASFATAEILGRVKDPEFINQGDGLYWVTAHSDLAYSAIPASIEIAGSALAANVVATHDEYAEDWPGLFSGGAYKDDQGFLELVGGLMMDDFSDIDTISDFDHYGPVVGVGYYEIGEDGIVDLGVAQTCALSASFSSSAYNPFNTLDMADDFDGLPDFDGVVAGLTEVKVQVASAGDDGIFGNWRDFFPGQYFARLFKFRLALKSADTSVTPLVTGFAWTVDMPDRFDRGTNIACPAAGLTVSFGKPFQIVPNVRVSVLSAEAGDQVGITDKTVNGFHYRILNEGLGVERLTDWAAQGY